MGKPEDLFDEEFLNGLVESVRLTQEGGAVGLSVAEYFLNPKQVLGIGYLVGKGRLECVSGGGEEPYVVRVKRNAG